MKADGVEVVGIGTGDDAFYDAAGGLYESLGFIKIPTAAISGKSPLLARKTGDEWTANTALF